MWERPDACHKWQCDVLRRGVLESSVFESCDLETGVLESGILESCDLESGVLESGILESGILESSVLESCFESGVLESSVLESCDFESGVLERIRRCRRAERELSRFVVSETIRRIVRRTVRRGRNARRLDVRVFERTVRSVWGAGCAGDASGRHRIQEGVRRILRYYRRRLLFCLTGHIPSIVLLIGRRWWCCVSSRRRSRYNATTVRRQRGCPRG